MRAVRSASVIEVVPAHYRVIALSIDLRKAPAPVGLFYFFFFSSFVWSRCMPKYIGNDQLGSTSGSASLKGAPGIVVLLGYVLGLSGLFHRLLFRGSNSR